MYRIDKSRLPFGLFPKHFLAVTACAGRCSGRKRIPPISRELNADIPCSFPAQKLASVKPLPAPLLSADDILLEDLKLSFGQPLPVEICCSQGPHLATGHHKGHKVLLLQVKKILRKQACRDQ